MSTYPDYEHYPESCEIIVPVTVKVPICIETAVITKKPSCIHKNGYKSATDSDDAEPVMQAESQS